MAHTPGGTLDSTLAALRREVEECRKMKYDWTGIKVATLETLLLTIGLLQQEVAALRAGEPTPFAEWEDGE